MVKRDRPYHYDPWRRMKDDRLLQRRALRRYEDTAEVVWKLAEREHHRSVFDLGCGDGRLLGMLHQAGWKGWMGGCDLSVTGVERTRTKVAPDALIYLYDVTRAVPQGERGRWDVVVCCEVLEHLAADHHVDAALANVVGLMKPRTGRCLVTVPREGLVKDVDHRREFTVGQVLEHMARAEVRQAREVRVRSSDWIFVAGCL